MPKRIARNVLLVILLAGCESDADKLERLKTDAIIANALLIAEEQTFDSAQTAWREEHPYPFEDSVAKSRWFDSMHVALKPYTQALDSLRNRHTLADRELRIFLDGR